MHNETSLGFDSNLATATKPGMPEAPQLLQQSILNKWEQVTFLSISIINTSVFYLSVISVSTSLPRAFSFHY